MRITSIRQRGPLGEFVIGGKVSLPALLIAYREVHRE
jgi:hypothetical protein